MKNLSYIFPFIIITLISCGESTSEKSGENEKELSTDTLSTPSIPEGYFSYSRPPVPSFLKSYEDVLDWNALLFESEEAYSEKYDAIYMKPKFDDSLYDLTKSRITLHGIISNFNAGTNVFYLYYPGTSFGCIPSPNVESRVIELHLDSNFNELDYDKSYEVFLTGVLSLNGEIVENTSLNLKNVEFLWSNEVHSDTSILYLKDKYFNNYVLQQ